MSIPIPAPTPEDQSPSPNQAPHGPDDMSITPQTPKTFGLKDAQISARDGEWVSVQDLIMGEDLHVKEFVVDDEMYVLECYPAVQGEGLYMGAPTTFVRLAGCTVGCVYCDTKYSWKARRGDRYTAYGLADYALSVTPAYARRFALTGGEPLEHPWYLVQKFLDRATNHWGAHTTIETSGVFLPDLEEALANGVSLLGPRILWSVAPKLDLAHANYPFPDLMEWVVLMQNFGHPLQFKFVVGSVEDLEEVGEKLTEARRGKFASALSSTPIFLQPVTAYNEKTPMEEVSRGIIELTKKLQDHLLHNFDDPGMKPYHYFPKLFIRPQQHSIYYGAKRQV